MSGVTGARSIRSVRGARAACLRAPVLGLVFLAMAACDVSGQRATQPPARADQQSNGRVDHRAKTSVEKFEWRASNSAPKGCPIDIISGDFYFPGGGGLYIPTAGIHAGWGREVSAHVVGPDQKSLPDSMEVVFFSYLEDRFYRGRFALPRDSIARLFAQGYRSFLTPSGHATYDALVAGVAPGGAVAVWASGGERQVEVFFGKAEPADLDWHRAMDAPPTVDRRGFVTSSLAEAAQSDPLVPIMMQHVPVGRWAAYRTRYHWRPAFEGIDRPERLDRVEFVNGERDYILLQPAGSGDVARPAPRFLIVDEARDKTSYRVSFDEQEITEAFAYLGAEGKPFELVFVKAARDGKPTLDVLVRDATETVPLRKAAVQAYGAG